MMVILLLCLLLILVLIVALPRFGKSHASFGSSQPCWPALSLLKRVLRRTKP